MKGLRIFRIPRRRPGPRPIPAKAGSQHKILSIPGEPQLVIEVCPRRVQLLDEPELPEPPPFLDLAFTTAGGLAALVRFPPDQGLAAVALAEAWKCFGAVLEDAPEQVVRVAGVERAVTPVGDYVDVEHGARSPTDVPILFSSCLAFGKRIFAGSRPSSGSVWAPAFAGENGDKLGLSVILQLAVQRPRLGRRAAPFADGLHPDRGQPPAAGAHQRIPRPHAARRLVQAHRLLAGAGQADLAGFHHVRGEGPRLEETRAPQPYVDAAGQVVAHEASAAGLALERRRLLRRGLAWCAGSAERCNEPSARCITPSPPCCAPASAVGRGVRREDREIVLDPMPAEAGRSSPPSPVNGRGVSGLAVRFSPLPSTGEE